MNGKVWATLPLEVALVRIQATTSLPAQGSQTSPLAKTRKPIVFQEEKSLRCLSKKESCHAR